MLLSPVLPLGFPAVSVGVNRHLEVPSTTQAWIHNIVLSGLNRALARFVPPAWFLDVLMCWYLAMAIALLRRRWLVFVWLASIAYTVYANAAGVDRVARYFSFQATSLPMSLGAALYLLRDRYEKLPPWRVASSLALSGATQLWPQSSTPIRAPTASHLYASCGVHSRRTARH